MVVIDDKLTDILEIHFLELPKFRKVRPDLSKPLDRWLIFIEDSPKKVRQMAMNNDPAIAKAEELLERLGSLDEVKRYYEAREMAIHDEVTRITGQKNSPKPYEDKNDPLETESVAQRFNLAVPRLKLPLQSIKLLLPRYKFLLLR